MSCYGITWETMEFCCGVGEITGISDYIKKPEQALHGLFTSIEELYDTRKAKWFQEVSLSIPDCPIMIFTQAYSKPRKSAGYGYDLKRYIEENNLGVVVAGKEARNPNTDNYVTAFIWTLNRSGIKAWAEKRGIEEP